MSKPGKEMNKAKPAGMLFVFTYVGALIYFIDKANGFWEVVLSFLQAAVWPALLINKIFTILQI